MNIENKVALITGGASGLDLATAKNLHAKGAKLVLLDLNEDNLKSAQEELKTNVTGVVTNVADEESVKNAIKSAIDEFGAIHILVNCAGIGSASKTVGRDGAHPLDIFKIVIDVNLVGTFNTLRLAAEEMGKNEPEADNECGVIINTASVAAFDGQIGQIAYSASKGGVVGMTLPMARDLAQNGIRVVTIAPGLFSTPMLRSLPEDVQDALGKSVPFPPRLGTPSEFAQLSVQIVENAMLNGETIRLDGAIRMAPK